MQSPDFGSETLGDIPVTVEIDAGEPDVDKILGQFDTEVASRASPDRV